MLNDMLDDKMMMAGLGVALWWQKDNWYSAQFMHLAPEQKDKRLQEWEDKVAKKMLDWSTESTAETAEMLELEMTVEQEAASKAGFRYMDFTYEDEPTDE